MIRKFFIAALAAFMTTAAGAVELNSEGRNPEYVASIVKRSQKCTDALGITGTDKGKQVLNIIANRYFALNDIYAERDSVKNIGGCTSWKLSSQGPLSSILPPYQPK